MGARRIWNSRALQVPAAQVNDIFLSHPHADHYADLPYMCPFRAFSDGFEALRV